MTTFRAISLALAATLFLPFAAAAATTIDIDAKANASNTFDRANATNFQEFALQRGVYTITPVNRLGDGGFDAMSVWNRNLGCEPTGAGCAQGWFWRVDLISAGNNLVPSTTGGSSTRINLTKDRFSTAANAFLVADANGPALFKLFANDTVFFGITDTPITDNRGGVSFNLERVSDVPIPLPAALLMGGVAMLGAVRTRRT